MDEIRQKGTGSRNFNGNVPNCNRNDDNFHVNWTNPDNANDNLRSRQKFPQAKISLNGIFLQISYPAIGHFGNFL